MNEHFLEELGNLAPLTDDSLVVDIFVGLFQTYITPTFPCFRGFRIEQSTSEEVSLAMAAAGGLYCSAPKSEMIAKWLHHFSRRKLLTAAYAQQSLKNTQPLDVLETWILSEIFAFLSGDKRSVSLLDIYHGHFVQAVRSCRNRYPDAGSDGKKLQQVIHAVNLLECYRVVLLQRSSMLYPFSMLPGFSTFDHLAAYDQNPLGLDSILSLVRSLASPSAVPQAIDSPVDSIQSLCALSLLLSHSRRLPASLSKYLQGPNSGSRRSSEAWRQEFLEMALQRWLSFHTSEPLPGTMMLFHTIHISMFSDFAKLEGSARDSLAQFSSLSQRPIIRLPENNVVPVSSNTIGERYPRSTERSCFSSDQDQEKALWHARKILQIAERVKARFPCRTGERMHLLREADQTVEGEPTHYSHSVYYASMVLWYSDKSNAGYSHKETVSIFRGIELLDSSPSPVAAVFKRTLKSIVSPSCHGNV